MNPYQAGFGLGLVLLAAFLIMGRGLGATAASGSIVAWLSGLAAPEWTAANPALKGYYAEPPWVNAVQGPEPVLPQAIVLPGGAARERLQRRASQRAQIDAEAAAFDEAGAPPGAALTPR